MLQIKTDIFLKDATTEIKLAKTEDLKTILIEFAKNEKDATKLYILAQRFIKTLDKINKMLNM